MSNNNLEEAKRQIEICNACRFCEGYCAVFPAMTKSKTFNIADMTQLANLCHNCQGCYHACQYTAPHEFNLNLPAVLADVRTESWERMSTPQSVAKIIQGYGGATAGVLIVALSLFFLWSRNTEQALNFYSYFSHETLVLIFMPLFIFPFFAIIFSLKKYWKEVEGEKIKITHLHSALKSVATLSNLSGGQGQGCNYEETDRFSNKRRWLHQSVMYGFLLCFASTSVATIMHYIFDVKAPYPFFSLPKLLGIPGGVMLTVGCLGLMWLKNKADKNLSSAKRWGGDWAFLMVLMLTGLSGLMLFAATGSLYLELILCFHLASVATLFLLTPYSKMVHGFFRLSALIRDAQLNGKAH